MHGHHQSSHHCLNPLLLSLASSTASAKHGSVHWLHELCGSDWSLQTPQYTIGTLNLCWLVVCFHV